MTEFWKPLATYTGVIDVSHWQGTIDWRAVPAEIALVFVKATQGSTAVDPMYLENVLGAEAGGRMVVPYHFLDASSPLAQLENFRRRMPPPGLPAMIDWEGRPPPAIPIMEDFGVLVAGVIGRSPLAYHGMYELSSPRINAWPWMVPKYGPQPQGPRWLFWQDRPNLRIPGIQGPVDHSVFAGTADELIEWWRTGAMPAGF
jgi:lysozyme